MMTVWSWNSAEGSWVGSLLVKGGLLGIGVAAVIGVGWTPPNIQQPDRFPLPALDDQFVSSQPSSTPATTARTLEAWVLPGLELEKENIQSTGRASFVDLNLGSRGELESLPGIGVALADRIVSYRNIHGTFQQVNDLVKVKGIGVKRLQRLEPFVMIQ